MQRHAGGMRTPMLSPILRSTPAPPVHVDRPSEVPDRRPPQTQGRSIVCDLLQGEGARRGDKGQSNPSSVSLRSPTLPSARKQSQEKLFLQYVTEGLRSRRGEASFISTPMTTKYFHWDASPLPAIIEEQSATLDTDPHQSRCARQLLPGEAILLGCLRFSSCRFRQVDEVPYGKAHAPAAPANVPSSRRGEASLISAPMKANHFRWDASPLHLISKAHYAPAGRMRVTQYPH